MLSNYIQALTKKAGTETQAKEAIQKQLYNGTMLTNMGTTLFNTIWANTVLRGNLFPRITDKDEAQDKFEEIISTTSNEFYNFIKVK